MPHWTHRYLLALLAPTWSGAGRARAVAWCAVGLTACTSAAEIQKEKFDKAELHYKLAGGYYASRNIELAIRELLTALEIDPSHADSRYLYGLILFGRMQYEEAAEHFKKALGANPKHFAARNQLGVTYIELHRYHDAVAMLEVLLKEPTYTTPYLVHNNLGLAWWKLGDLRQADKHFRMAVFLNEKFCQGHRNLGLVAMDLRDYAQAVEHMTEAVARCPQYAELHLQHGEALEADRRYAEARKAYKQCAKLAGETPMGRRCRTRLGPAASEEGGEDERTP